MAAGNLQGRLAVAGLIVLALGLSGCGRKGPLDPPPGAAISQPEAKQQAQTPSDIFGAPQPAEEGPPTATPGPKRRIILDGLLN